MLIWQDSDGGNLALEPAAPYDLPIVLAHLAGGILPTPEVVAEFTLSVLSGHDHAWPVPATNTNGLEAG